MASGEPFTSWKGETKAKKSNQERTPSKELGETAIIKLVFYTESVQLTETCRKRDSFLFITARKIVEV